MFLLRARYGTVYAVPLTSMSILRIANVIQIFQIVLQLNFDRIN